MPQRRNIMSEYLCAAPILPATSSGILLVRLVEKSYFLMIFIKKNRESHENLTI